MNEENNAILASLKKKIENGPENVPENTLPKKEEKKPVTSSPEIAPAFDMDSIDSILNMASTTIGNDELDSLFEQRKKYIDYLRINEENLESRKALGQKVKTEKEMEAERYLESITKESDLAFQEGLIDEEVFNKIKKINEFLDKLQEEEKNKELSGDKKNIKRQLYDGRDKINETIKALAKEKKSVENAEISKRIQEYTSNVENHYNEMSQFFDQKIREIEENPGILKKIELEKKEIDRIHKLENERQQKEIIENLTKFIPSVEARHNNSLKRIASLLGENEEFIENFKALTEKGTTNEEIKSFTDSIRSKLINAIIDGEGEKQLSDPKEVVPWMIKTGVDYFQATNYMNDPKILKFLKNKIKEGDEKSIQMLGKMELVVGENELFRKIFGAKFINIENKPQKTRFWKSFDDRKDNDASGLTQKRKEDRARMASEQKAKAEEAKKKDLEIEAFFEAGGLPVSCPVFKEFKGKKVIDSYKKGYIKFERFVSKNGTDCLRIIEILGDLPLKVGQVSSKDGGQFPSWVKEHLI